MKKQFVLSLAYPTVAEILLFAFYYCYLFNDMRGLLAIVFMLQ